MNLVRRAIAAAAKAVGLMTPVSGLGGWRGLVREPFSGAWQRNQEMRQEDVLCVPTVYSCITLIANDIGKLRARLVQRDDDGIWSDAKSNSPYWQVLRRQNRFQNHVQFKQWWLMSKLRRGNTYALKERDQRGIVVRLHLLDPDRVLPLVSDDGGVYYQLSQDNLAGVRENSVTVPASEIIHDRMNCLYHPLVGISPLYAAAIAAGIGLHIQNTTASFFANNSRPGGVLIVPGRIDDATAIALKATWESGYGGSNSGKVAVLGDGMKFEPMATNAVDAQLIETLRWTDERICSVFHVPAYKVGVGAPPSYNNIEALEQGYYASCLQSLIEELEACLDEGLGLETPIDGRQMGVELDLDGLLRMDSKTLIETMGKGVTDALFTTDEARKRLNLPSVPGGNTIWRQQQYFSLEALAKRDSKPPAAVPPAAPAPSPAPGAEGEPQEEQPAEEVVRIAGGFIQKFMAEAERVRAASASPVEA